MIEDGVLYPSMGHRFGAKFYFRIIEITGAAPIGRKLRLIDIIGVFADFEDLRTRSGARLEQFLDSDSSGNIGKLGGLRRLQTSSQAQRQRARHSIARADDIELFQ